MCWWRCYQLALECVTRGLLNSVAFAAPKNPVPDPDDSFNTHADDNNNILVPIRGFVCEAITNGADRVCLF